jgi:anti-anti-sigma factor
VDLLTTIVDATPDGPVWLRVSGEVDAMTAPTLASAITECIEVAASCTNRLLILDMTAVTFFGSAAAATFAQADEKSGSRRVEIRVVASRIVRRVLQVTKLDAVLKVYATAAEALS